MKLCKGFDEFACWCCARCSNETDETLADSLIIDPDDEFKHCNHHVRFSDVIKAERQD